MLKRREAFFYAYNDKGFKLSLSYYDSEMHIGLDAAMELGTLLGLTAK